MKSCFQGTIHFFKIITKILYWTLDFQGSVYGYVQQTLTIFYIQTKNIHHWATNQKQCILSIPNIKLLFLLWFNGLFCWCLYFVCVFLLLKFIRYSPDQCLLHLFDITSFISVNHICTWKICAFTLAGTLFQLLRHAS